MNVRKRNMWQKIMIAVCALLGSVLIALAIALPQAGFASGDEKEFALTEVNLEKKDGYEFTWALSREQMYNLVVVTVTYTEVLPDDSEETPEEIVETLTLSGSGTNYTADTGEAVTFSLVSDTITATVTPRDGYGTDSVDGTLVVTYVAQKVHGITATYNKSENYTMATTPNVNDFTVSWEYNDGTVGTSLTNDLYEFGTINLFPDTFLNKGEVFEKDIPIVLTAKGSEMSEAGGVKYTTSATVSIEFDEPVDVARRLKGQLSPHPARSENIDLTGLEVDITFESGFDSQTYSAPLKAFDSSAFTIVYKNDQGGTETVLTTAVTRCEITFTYPDSTFTATGTFPITVTPISVAAPTFPTNNFVNYFEGVNIDITGLDFSGQFEAPLPNAQVLVTSDGGSTADYEENQTDANTYNIVFKKPGIGYTVTVTLCDEQGVKGGDFQWQSPAPPAKKLDEYTIEYHVQVEKGNWEITLAGGFEWIYGNAAETGSVTGDLQGTDDNENETFAYNQTIPSGDAASLEYHLEYNADVTADADDAGWTAGTPVGAGKYLIRAVSHETEYYYSATSAAVAAVVTPRHIEATNTLKNPTYDRATTYNGTDILKTSGINNVISGDDLEIAVKNPDDTDFSAKYWKNGGYEVKLVLGNTNYVFTEVAGDWDTLEDLADNRKTEEAKFIINKRVIKYSVWQDNFYYGAPADISVNLVDATDGQYVADPTILYTKTVGGATHSDRTDIDKWDAGAYTVIYTPNYGGTDTDEKNSLTLTAVTANFTINKAQISGAALADDEKTYTPSGNSFTVGGVDIANGGLGDYSALTEIVTITVNGVRADFTAITRELGTDSESFTLTNVDKYTVTVTLNADNFAWAGGANPTAVWTIIKAQVTQVVAPTDDITFDHNAHDLTLANWNDDLMTVAVTGTSASGGNITDITLPNETADIATIKYAGEYTFKFTLKDYDNYEWVDGTESATIEFTFTLKRAEAKLLATAGEVDFNDGTTQYFVLPEAAKASAYSEKLNTLSFVFTIADEKGTEVATDATAETTEITSSGVYIYTITGFTGDDVDNYVMPAGGLTFTYTVKSQNLTIPTFNKTGNELTYNGAEQSILGFITNYLTNNYGERIVITINRGSELVDSGADPKVKDVYFDDNQVKAYTATVKPATNYNWKVDGTSYAEDEVFDFEFTVQKYGLTVSWNSGSLSSVYGSAPELTYTLDERGTDDVSIITGYKNKDHNAIANLDENSPAGNYFVYATDLDGAAKDNYYLKVNADTAYTVKKQAIAKPLLSSPFEGVYGGAPTASLYDNSNFDTDLFGASVTGYRPADWFDDKTKRDLDLDGTGTEFAVATGIFTYGAAGYYTVTFTIDDSANYCWQGDGKETDFTYSGDGYTCAWNDFARIERKELTAPAFGTRKEGDKTIQNRAQEWGDFKPTAISDKINNPIDGVKVTVQYGKRDVVGNGYEYGALQDDVAGAKDNAAIGQYYALVSVDGTVAGVDILNYVWKTSADWDTQIQYVAGEDKKVYSEGAVAIYLHYAITSSQLPLKFEDIEYVFGANGTVNGATELKDFFAALKLDADSESMLGEALMEWVEGNAGNQVRIATNDDEGYAAPVFTGANGDDLENGLPWQVGEYTVTFTVIFGNVDYQPLTVSNLAVKVNVRPVELAWQNLSKTYDGTTGLDAQDIVEMVNVPSRASGNIALPTLTIYDFGNKTIKNADDYSLCVRLSGDNAGNFTTDGALNSYTAADNSTVTDSEDPVPFIINKYAFTATAKDVAEHVYGDDLPEGVDAWTVSGDVEADRPEGFDSDIKNIVLSIMKGSTEYLKPSVGDYTISLDWINEAEGANYDVTFVNTASFTVVEREITVTVDGATGNKYESVYYASATNYTANNYEYSATTENGTGDAIITGDTPFELRSAVTQSSAVNADGYPITIKVTDGNYKITVLGEIYDSTNAATATDTKYLHVIAPATLDPTVEASRSVTYNATEFAYLTTNEVNGQNLATDVGANAVTWKILKSTDGAGVPDGSEADWEEYDANTHFGKIVGKYYFYVMVEAENHTAKVIADNGAPFCLEITVADLAYESGIASGELEYDSAAHPYLVNQKVSGVSEDDIANANVKWHIAVVNDENSTADGASFVEFDAATHALTDVSVVYYFVKITADNYGDLTVSADGRPFKYEITQATLTLKVDMSIFFNEINPATAGYYMDGNAVTVEKLIAGYGKVFSLDGFKGSDESKFTGGELENISGSFTYSTAYAQGDGTDKTYAITATLALTSLNYKFEAAEGTLEVKQLPVSATVKTDPALEAAYGATGLAMPEAVVETLQTSTYDEAQVIDISNLTAADILTVSTDALVESGNAYTTNVVKWVGGIIGGTLEGYDIVLTLGGDFEWDSTGYATQYYTITAAKNLISTEGYTLFDDAPAYKGAQGAEAAWVYGKLADDGYKADGKHKPMGFTMLDHTNALTVTLKFGDKELATATITASDDVQNKLIALFASVDNFNAGNYTVTYEMDASNNYDEFTEVWCFSVAKRNVTVTPDEVSVIYGEEVDGKYLLSENSYKYAHTPLDGYGDTAEVITDIIGFTFVTVKDGAETDYVAGWNVATYAVKAKVNASFTNYTGTLEEETDNYIFTFKENAFEVTPRPVTIQIKNASNHYMLIGTYHSDTKKYDIEPWATLGYDYFGDSKEFFNGELPVEFHTVALVDSLTTKGFGQYAIYAVFKGETEKNNYSITVQNAVYGAEVSKEVLDGTDDGLVIKHNGGLVGGVFTVEKAVLTAVRSGPYFKDANGDAEFGGEKYTLYASSSESGYANVYDGRAKYYFATTNVDREDLKSLIPSFTPVYTKGGAEIDGAPVNVGTYYVTFKPDDANANFAELSVSGDDIYINARQLSVASQLVGGNIQSDNRGTYNGSAYTLTFTFTEVVGDEVLGLDVALSNVDATVTKPTAGATRNKLVIEAVNAGTYVITVTLSGDGMDNYSLSGGEYEFTLTIDKASLYVVVQNASIEYGTPLTPNDLFKVAYSLTNGNATETDPALKTLIDENIASGKLTAPADFKYSVTNVNGGAGYLPTVDAGNIFDVIFDTENNFVSSNYEVTPVVGTLTVIQRKIEVNVYGYDENAAKNQDIAHSVYDATNHDGVGNAFETNYGDNKAKYLALAAGSSFGESNKNVQDLGAALTIPNNSTNAGRYNISASDDDDNFEITFLYNGGALTGSNCPVYRIDHRPLTAKVQAAGTAYETNESTVTVIYGNAAEQSLFKVCYDGWVANQASQFENKYNVVFVIGETGNTYEAYKSIVGQEYTVRISGFTAGTSAFENYDVTLVDATLAITPRPITASTSNRVYEPDTTNYHGGAYGLPREAQITFGGVDTQERLADGYSLSYDTELGEGQTAGTAPVKVGEYFVTVTLEKNANDLYNYTFASVTGEEKISSELAYNVTKKQVNLVWSDTIVNDLAGETVKNVTLNGGFVADVMNVVSFTLGENAIPSADYTANNGGLNIDVGKINGLYTITIELKASALENYQLVENSSGTMTEVTRRVVSFTVAIGANTSTEIEFVTDNMGSWIYGESAKTPTANVKLKSSGATLSNAIVIFDYVPVSGAPADAVLDKVYGSLDGWSYDNTKWTASVSNAGKYLLRARYAGSADYLPANPVYYYFEIERAELAKPTVETPESVYAEERGVGSVQSKITGYNASAMQIVSLSAGVQAPVSGDGVTLRATGKGDYTIVITLTDSVNYVWNDGTTDDVTLTWKVLPATDNVLEWSNSLTTVDYAESYTLEAIPQEYSYNIAISYSYAARADGETEPADGASWISGFPVNAGKYWIRAVGRSPEGNYNDADCDRAFEILKTELKLKPTGSMTFGDEFDGSSLTMNDYAVISGLLNGDTEQMIVRDLTNIAFTVTDAPASGLWAAREYALEISAEATNYVIVSETGVFTVDKARLYVTLGNNASSLYSHTPDYSQVSVTLRGQVGGDNDDLVTLLKDYIVGDATASSDAGRYDVSLSVTEIDNYVLSVTAGVYTVEKLPVRVEVDWGRYDFGASPVLPRVTKVTDNATGSELTFDSEEFRFVYADGTENAPTAAGSHVVSVRIVDDSNFVLAAPVSGTFVINLTELDATLIVWETVYYDIQIKKPEVLGITGDEFSKDMFEVSYVGDWNRAGVAYTIELKLTHPESTKWKSVEGEVRTITYTVARGTNELTESITIKGWAYGDYSNENLPTATSKFGTVTFEYTDSENGVYTAAAPANGNVGTYWVRAVVGETTDYEYYASPAVSFEITKKTISAPTLDIITEEGNDLKNDVYTGRSMFAEVLNYESTLMHVHYDGNTRINGNFMMVFATNAGTYTVTVKLINPDNYEWANGTELDGDGNARLTWTIARKKIALPTPNDAPMMVNGSELKYYPLGFDAAIMGIDGNTSGYGGTFNATVTIIDTDNYEWEDGTQRALPFEWTVIGADTVFIVVISILSALAAGAAIAAIVEGVRYYKKKEEQKQSQQDGAEREGE